MCAAWRFRISNFSISFLQVLITNITWSFGTSMWNKFGAQVELVFLLGSFVSILWSPIMVLVLISAVVKLEVNYRSFNFEKWVFRFIFLLTDALNIMSRLSCVNGIGRCMRLCATAYTFLASYAFHYITITNDSIQTIMSGTILIFVSKTLHWYFSAFVL